MPHLPGAVLPGGVHVDDSLPSRSPGRLHVVGLGGSAGAIPTLVSLLQTTAPGGLAYVIVLHLAAEHDATLAELLREHSPMPVLQVNGPVTLAADIIYVIPSGRAVQMDAGGRLQLRPLPMARPGRIAVDMFLRMLADSHGPRAIGVVLSGMDDDGAVGIKRIKERGGLTIAQDPQEAYHDGMPRAAIATGMVDWVLPVAAMHHRISRYLDVGRHLTLPTQRRDDVGGQAGPGSAEPAMCEVLALLQARTGRRVTHYRPTSLLHRIGRRMQVNGVADLAAYLDCLRDQPGEAEALSRDLLISVTHFFRDPDCFDALAREIAPLFDDKSSADVIRVWVTACATGEEAYAIAMLLAEFARSLDEPPAVQVFATDLDEQALRTARAGLYPLTIATDVSEDRLSRFFIKESHGYRIRRELREQVLFAAHDVLLDSPFPRIDLFACRNLLTHFDEEARRRVFETAHFALSPGGRMFLGATETVDAGSPLFDVVDQEHRVYARRATPPAIAPMPPGQDAPARALEAQETQPSQPGAWQPRRSSAWPELHFKMLEALGPPSILIDESQAILHVSPGAARYLQFRGGEPSRDLLQVIHPALRAELQAAIAWMAHGELRLETAPLTLDLDGHPATVRMAVTRASDVAPGLLLVMLDASRIGAAEPLPAPGSAVARVDRLDPELARLRARLRDAVERYETSSDELKTRNEELRARNDELQSATEALVTSREELQSINEELTTVNHELGAKVDELAQANSDLQGLIAATAIAALFLDRDLRVTRFTSAVVSLFNLIPTDIGRPLADLRSQLDYPELPVDARRVLQSLRPIEREVGGAAGRWYLARMLPYRTDDHHASGIVLTLVDATERRQILAALRLSEERFSAIAHKAAVGVLQSSRDGVITFANAFFCDLLGYRERELVGKSVLELVHPDDRAVSREKFNALAAEDTFQVVKRLRRKDGSSTWVHNSVSCLPSSGNKPESVLVVCIDINERNEAEEALRTSQEGLRLMVDNAMEYAIFATGLDRRVTSWNAGAQRLLGWDEGEILGRPCDVIFTAEDRAAGLPAREAAEALADGRSFDERLHLRKNGDRFWASGALMPMRDRSGDVVGFVKVLRDQTAQRETLDRLAAHREELVNALDDNQSARRQLQAADLAKDRFLAVVSHELRNPLAAIAGVAERLRDPAGLDCAGRERAHAVLADQVESMTRQLDDLLDMSRLRSGRLALQKRPTVLATVVDQAIRTAQPLLERRRQVLSTRLPEAPVRLCVDGARMSQVLSNLLANAATSADEGGRITLSAGTERGQCVIEVRDDGRGLDETALASLFDVPWRSSEPDVARPDSLGVGLALVRSVVSLHRGSVGASSDGPGRGSTFTIRLPLHQAADDTSAGS